jgi:hypothetical protein
MSIISKEAARRELARRARLRQRNLDTAYLFDATFPQQKAFVDDPSNLKTLWCTRRAAKSYTAGLYMMSEALKNPGSNILFIGLTRASAKAIVWKDILMAINKRYGLRCRFNKADLSVSVPGGSLISITGVDSDENEMLKLLGKKYRLVCIDEASMYSVDVRNLVYGVLRPAMVDPNTEGMRGTICLMGTSSNFPRGLFYDITVGKERGWSVHTWTAHENPYVAKQWQEELDEIKRDRPLYLETPQYKQFYLNEWSVDDTKLVYRFDDQRNTYRQLPQDLSPEGWRFVLGVDTGWEDDNAFVLCGYHENDDRLYVIRTFNKPRMTFDQVVVKINEFMLDPMYPVSKVIIDGANKQGVESMRIRSSIPFEYADKQGKVDFIEMLNGDLIQAKIRINYKCETLTNELRGLVWLTDGDKIVLPKKENPSLSNHLCDAFLYAWRNGYHYHSVPKEVKLVKYSKEWYEKQAEDIWEKEREMLEQATTWADESGWPKD